MWDDILKYSQDYQSAVLTYVESSGFPFSLRCQLEPEHETRYLRLSLPETFQAGHGSVSLLWHRHDERLWNLNSFAVRGFLDKDSGGWFVKPERFIPGVGVGGWRSYWNFLVNGRRTTKQYLKKRGLSRPRLNWDEWDTIFLQERK